MSSSYSIIPRSLYQTSTLAASTNIAVVLLIAGSSLSQLLLTGIFDARKLSKLLDLDVRQFSEMLTLLGLFS